jgi:hypothetical protein
VEPTRFLEITLVWAKVLTPAISSLEKKSFLNKMLEKVQSANLNVSKAKQINIFKMNSQILM